MVMVPLEAPLEADLPSHEALKRLEENEFDLSLVQSDEIRVVYRHLLAQLGERKLGLPIKANSSPPRIDRVIEHSLELGVVAQRLAADPVPLLVVDRNGPSYIVTRSDFTRAAGQLGVLAVLAALDAALDVLIAPYDEEGWLTLTDDERESLAGIAERASQRGEDLPPMRFLSLGARLRVVRNLGLGERLGMNLGSQSDHELVTDVRNDIAHGREVDSGAKVIGALLLAERILDAIINQPGSEPG